MARRNKKPVKPAPRKPKADGETYTYDWRKHGGRGHDGKFRRND
jgi:hypothetical protein